MQDKEIQIPPERADRYLNDAISDAMEGKPEKDTSKINLTPHEMHDILCSIPGMSTNKVEKAMKIIYEKESFFTFLKHFHLLSISK